MQDHRDDLFQDDVARGVRRTFIDQPTTAPQGASSASLVAVSAR